MSVSWLLPSLQLEVHSETQAQRNPLALTAELFNHLSVGLGPWISVNKHSIEIISSLLCSAVSFSHSRTPFFPFPAVSLSLFPFSSPQGPCVMELYVFFCSTWPDSLPAPLRAYTLLIFFFFFISYGSLYSILTCWQAWPHFNTHSTSSWSESAILDVVFSYQTLWFCDCTTLKLFLEIPLIPRHQCLIYYCFLYACSAMIEGTYKTIIYDHQC